MSQIRTIVFDMDGTLVDSSVDIANAMNVVMKRAHLPKLSLERVKKLVGRGAMSLIERAMNIGDLKTARRIRNKFLNHYEEHLLDNTKPYRGIVPLIKKLYGNFNLAIATNKQARLGKETVKGLDLHRHFEIVVGLDTLGKSKPDPAMLTHIAKELGNKPNELIMVGDSPVDVETAKNFGCASCAVTWGFCSLTEIKKAKPDYIIDKPSELLEIVK